MKRQTVRVLFCCHIAALVFGLMGLLIALPHPEWWSQSSIGVGFFLFGIHYAGSLHILFGATTMLFFGCFFVGIRKTLIFFVASTTISLCMELLGTSTGFPFGPYAYTDFLGYKILGHVPFSIPLSWFYMGFTAFLLANQLVMRAKWPGQTLCSLLLGTYFLTVWDLSLDPSMASGHMAVQFWIWYTPGPYFGMPISNLVGWTVTGLIYMTVSRLVWRGNLRGNYPLGWLPFGVYVANTCFAIVLTLSYGIWPPLFIALLLGLLPASCIFFPFTPRLGGRSGATLVQHMSHLTIRKGSKLLLKKHVSYQVRGLEHVPGHGSVLFVARHYHHLYDGCLLLSLVPRTLHILIALDWIQRPFQRVLMETACALARWPVVLRGERLRADAHLPESAYQASEQRRYLRRATELSIQLLRRGEALVIFPEAYPVLDPAPSSRDEHQEFLPFRAGFERLISLAERDGWTQVAVVPVGLHYLHQKHWKAIVRFGQALFLRDFPNARLLMQAVEQQVQALSLSSTPGYSSAFTQLPEVSHYEADKD